MGAFMLASCDFLFLFSNWRTNFSPVVVRKVENDKEASPSSSASTSFFGGGDLFGRIRTSFSALNTGLHNSLASLVERFHGGDGASSSATAYADVGELLKALKRLVAYVGSDRHFIALAPEEKSEALLQTLDHYYARALDFMMATPEARRRDATKLTPLGYKAPSSPNAARKNTTAKNANGTTRYGGVLAFFLRVTN